MTEHMSVTATLHLDHLKLPEDGIRGYFLRQPRYTDYGLAVAEWRTDYAIEWEGGDLWLKGEIAFVDGEARFVGVHATFPMKGEWPCEISEPLMVMLLSKMKVKAGSGYQLLMKQPRWNELAEKSREVSE